jgi:hypothetical protein
MSRSRIFSTIVISFSLLVTAASAQVVDQSYDPGSAGGYTFNSSNPQGQSFTVGITGLLTQVDIRAYNFFGGANAPLTASVYEFIPGSPPTLGALLATASMPQSSVPSTSGFVSFDLSASSPTVTIGQQLVLTASTTGSNSYLWEGRTPGSYSSGQAYVVSGNNLFTTLAGTGWDFGFRTHVIPVPEPTGMTSTLAIVLVFVSSRSPKMSLSR